MNDEAAIEYLSNVAAPRWWPVYEWALSDPKRPLRKSQMMALDMACWLLEKEYLAYRVRMAVNMWITRTNTRARDYTLSRITAAAERLVVKLIHGVDEFIESSRLADPGDERLVEGLAYTPRQRRQTLRVRHGSQNQLGIHHQGKRIRNDLSC